MIWLVNFIEILPDLPPPPGTVKIESNLFMDKGAVTYMDYYEFINFGSFSKSNKYSGVIPVDTTITYKNEILWKNPKFHNFPILGLSLEQMENYCKWRSEAVNLMIHDSDLRCSNNKYWNKFDKVDPDKKYHVVYSVSSTFKIENYCSKISNQDFDEILIDGVCYAKRQRKVKSLNRSDFFAFRCIAEYKMKN